MRGGRPAQRGRIGHVERGKRIGEHAAVDDLAAVRQAVDTAGHRPRFTRAPRRTTAVRHHRSEEHTSELQSLMRISYAVFCLKKKKQQHTHTKRTNSSASIHMI